MDNLIDSIERNGLDEPLILTEDRYILSGIGVTRCELSWLGSTCPHSDKASPSRRQHGVSPDLVEYNPQRIKHAGSLLKEALLRDTPVDTYAAIEENVRERPWKSMPSLWRWPVPSSWSRSARRNANSWKPSRRLSRPWELLAVVNSADPLPPLELSASHFDTQAEQMGRGTLPLQKQ